MRYDQGVAKAKKPTAPAVAADPLAEPMRAFVRGDYPRARAGFAAVLEDPEVTGSERETAGELLEATRVDRLTLGVGLACLALFGVAALLTALVQP